MAMKQLLLTSVTALFLATGAVNAETNVLGCFTRTYDKTHLADHPDQLVTAVTLRIYHPPSNEDATRMNMKATWADLEVKVRGRDVALTTTATCHKSEPPNPHLMKHLPPPDALWCGVECDGGGIGVAPRGDHAMMYLGNGIRVSVKGLSCGGTRKKRHCRETRTTTYFGSIASTNARSGRAPALRRRSA